MNEITWVRSGLLYIYFNNVIASYPSLAFKLCLLNFFKLSSNAKILKESSSTIKTYYSVFLVIGGYNKSVSEKSIYSLDN